MGHADSNSKEAGIERHHDKAHRFRHSPLEADDGEDDRDEHYEECGTGHLGRRHPCDGGEGNTTTLREAALDEGSGEQGRGTPR